MSTLILIALIVGVLTLIIGRFVDDSTLTLIGTFISVLSLIFAIYVWLSIDSICDENMCIVKKGDSDNSWLVEGRSIDEQVLGNLSCIRRDNTRYRNSYRFTPCCSFLTG